MMHHLVFFHWNCRDLMGRKQGYFAGQNELALLLFLLFFCLVVEKMQEMKRKLNIWIRHEKDPKN